MARPIEVIAENRSTDDKRNVVAFEFFAEAARDGEGQSASKERMVFRKRRTLASGSGPDRRAKRLCKGNGLVPAIAPVDGRPVDQNGDDASDKILANSASRAGSGAKRWLTSPHHRGTGTWLLPIVEGKREKDRTRGG